MSGEACWQQELGEVLRSQLPGTVHHEAGHAVVAHVCGFTIRSVTARSRPYTEEERAMAQREGYAAGDTDLDYGSALVDGQPKDENSARPWAMSIKAGGLAQKKATGSVKPEHVSNDDATVNAAAIRLLGEKVAPAWISKVTEETQSLLEREDVWAAVTACANLLLKRGTITRMETLSVIPRHLKHPGCLCP